MTIPDPDEIQSQVTAVVRPRTDRYLHSFGIIREYLSFGRMPNDILLQD